MTPAAAARKLCGKLDARGLVAADVFHQSGPDLETLAENQPDPERRLQARDLFQRTLEFVVLCGATHMTALPGIHWPEEPYEASLARAAEEHAWRVEQAAKSNVVYAVEPHMWSIVKTPEQTARLLDMTNIAVDLSATQTNIVMADISATGSTADDVLKTLRENGIVAHEYTPQIVRFTFHRHITDQDVTSVLDVLRKYFDKRNSAHQRGA